MKGKRELDPRFIVWTRNLLSLLSIGGTWMVPRSLVMVKRINADTVELISDDQSLRDEDIIWDYIEAAGFKITNRPTPREKLN